MSKVILLYREYETPEEEILAAAKAGFSTTPYRSHIPPGSLVVGRYSVEPFYEDQANDLALSGTRLVNSVEQRNYLANLEQWYQDCKEVTPRTRFSLAEFLGELGEPNTGYVLKGNTNSRRDLWYTHMFATDKHAVVGIHQRLSEDSLTGKQGIVIREYVHLEQVGTADPGAPPLSSEYRVFVCHQQIVGTAFYWNGLRERCWVDPSMHAEAARFVDKHVIPRVGEKAAFYTADVAMYSHEYADVYGEENPRKGYPWVLIELNDAQMAGLSGLDPGRFYKRLREAL